MVLWSGLLATWFVPGVHRKLRFSARVLGLPALPLPRTPHPHLNSRELLTIATIATIPSPFARTLSSFHFLLSPCPKSPKFKPALRLSQDQLFQSGAEGSETEQSMAMAATAVCASSTSFFAGASSWECRSNGAQISQPLVGRSRCSGKAGCSSSSSSRESCRVAVSARNRLSSVGSSSSSSSSTGPQSRQWRWQAVAEQLQAAETEETTEEGGFPADTLSVFFEAEGSLPEASVTKLIAVLEAVEGVSNVEVTATSDGTATVRLTKQMNVQATGVASGLVDVLLKGGFKLQALNLGFDEENGDDDDFYEYDLASSTEESGVAE